MGLAEPRKRRKISQDPNNKHWSTNTTNFGHKILTSQGWTPGSHLGARDAPHAELHSAASFSHIRVALKENTLGLGAILGGGGLVDGERTSLDAFQSLLGRLNGKSEEALLKEQSARDDFRRGEYVESRVGAMKFVKGGWLVGNEIRDRGEAEDVHVQQQPDNVGEEVKPRKKKDKESKEKKKRRREKAEGQVGSLDSDIPCTEESLQDTGISNGKVEEEVISSRKKDKEKKEKKKKRRREEVEEQVLDLNDIPSAEEPSKDDSVTGPDNVKVLGKAPSPPAAPPIQQPSQAQQLHQTNQAPQIQPATDTATAKSNQETQTKPTKVTRKRAFKHWLEQHPPNPSELPDAETLSPDKLEKAALKQARKQWCKSEAKARKAAKKIRKLETGFGSKTEERRQRFKKRPEVATPRALASLLSKPPVKNAGSGANAVGLGNRGAEGTGTRADGGDPGTKQAGERGAKGEERTEDRNKKGAKGMASDSAANEEKKGNNGSVPSGGSRVVLRQKSIEQKRMAVRDQRALNEIFMIKA